MPDSRMGTPNILITGGSSGLGFAAARRVATRTEGRVLITATALDRAEAAAAAIRRSSGNDRVTGLAVDLTEPESITAGADSVREALGGTELLQAVALNAGVQVVSGLQRTAEGHERTMALNHFGHVRLLAALWSLLDRPARLVFTGSATHDPDDPLARAFGFRGSSFTSLREWADDSADPERPTRGQGLDRYANAKLANIMTATALAQRYPASELEVFALDPGLMPGTGLARDRTPLERVAWRSLMRWLAPALPRTSTAERSGRMLADLLTDSRYAGRTGEYLDYNDEPARSSATARDPEAAQRMLDETLTFLGVSLDRGASA